MAINVLVNGAKGKMGKEAVAAISADPELKLVDQTDLGDDLSARIKSSKAQVVVDFTHPSVAIKNAETILDAGASPVIGTTGIKLEDIKKLQKKAKDKKLGGLIAPNFGIGAVLMMKYAADAAKYLPNVEIVEYHHDNKADAPSGTAIKTAEQILEANLNIQGPNKKSKEELRGALGAEMGNIRLHAVRLPGFVASQEVILGGVGQTLKIRHDTINRESFMPGVVMACKKVVGLKEMVYGLEKIL
ncbi:MAG: 4-hydroxy-tetrahydrodipicolinate reductase [Candidatus Margulisbacteria bacterium]|nr:4-hydroxy-tetrahydrodipicolinate reductase [Candidatus Margulisiibacteriota bacterium]